MLPTLAVLAALRSAFRTYIVAQQGAPGWRLMMVKAPFTPSPDLTIDDVTPDTDLAPFPFEISDSGHFDGRDPATGDYVTLYFAGSGVQLLINATDFPRTVYGWIITTADTFAVLASKLLPTPLDIVSLEDGIPNPEIGFHLPMNLIR